MRSTLLDMVQHTHALGCIDLVKINGTDENTDLYATSTDKSIVVHGRYHNVVPEFEDTFGMPSLSVLKTILNIGEYADNATITVNRTAGKGPVTMTFVNEDGDFTNVYRLMLGPVVDSQIANFISDPNLKWDIEFEPTVSAIQRLEDQKAANTGESFFYPAVVDGDLIFYFGDGSSHAGNFVFERDVCDGTLNNNNEWPIDHIIKILKLSGNKTMRMKPNTGMQIEVDSGVVVYTYTLPGKVRVKSAI